MSGRGRACDSRTEGETARGAARGNGAMRSANFPLHRPLLALAENRGDLQSSDGETARQRREQSAKHDYPSVPALRDAVAEYIHYYNSERPHQARDYDMPWEVHQDALEQAQTSEPRGGKRGRALSAYAAPPTGYRPIGASLQPAAGSLPAG